ncbi:hypothetical protein ACFYOF_16900 [Streptomyces sp. NPDC007148]|uniref:hypothetical protein n=1 Tax=Streptomyces sp. NPDC007148 TaxID=3364775 RepID=UPI0036ABE445
MHYGSLAATGATLTIGGVVLDQVWLVGAAAGLVLVGALCVRFGFRRGKTPSDV